MGVLHEELHGQSGGKSAIYIDKATLVGLVLQDLVKLFSQAGKSARPIEDESKLGSGRDYLFGARYVDSNFGSPITGTRPAFAQPAAYVPPDFEAAAQNASLSWERSPTRGRELHLKFDEMLEVTIDLGVYVPPERDDTNPQNDKEADLIDVFSQVSVNVFGFSFIVEPGNAKITFRAAELRFKDRFVRVDDAALTDIMTRRNLSEPVIGRMEGRVSAYLQNQLSESLSRATDLDISDLFPSTQLAGNIAPHIIGSGGYLALVPEELAIDTSMADPCADPGIGEPIDSQRKGSPGQPGRVTFGALQPIDKTASFGRRAEGEGPIGLMLSLDTLMSMSTRRIPSFSFEDKETSFIGTSVKGTVSFGLTEYKINRKNKSIDMYVDLNLRADVDFDVDIGCGNRGAFGDGSLESSGRITLSFQLVPTASGRRGNQKLRFKPARTRDTRMDDIDISANLFKYWFLAFGFYGAGWVWTMDYLIEDLLEKKIQSRLENRVRNHMRTFTPNMVAGDKWQEIKQKLKKAFGRSRPEELVSLNSAYKDTLLLSFGTDAGAPVSAGDLFPYPNSDADR